MLFRAGLHAVFPSFVPVLSQRYTDCCYRCGVHGITVVIFGIAAVFLFLQMELETQSGGTDLDYEIPRAVAGPSGVCIIERRPNSEPDTPCPHRLFGVSCLAICPRPVWRADGPVRIGL